MTRPPYDPRNRPVARHHRVLDGAADGGVVVFFPELPNWVAMSRFEYLLFSLCGGAVPLGTLARAYMDLYGGDRAAAEHRFRSFFSFLAEAGAFEGDRDADAETARPPAYSLVFLNVIGACNLRCTYCYASSIVHEKLLPIERWVDVVRRISSANPRADFVILGGEPFLRKDILDLAAFIRARGHRLVIVTNGTRLDDRLIDRLAEIRPIVQVSLDGSCDEVNARTRGGDFGAIERAIDRMRALDIDVIIAPTVTTENEGELPALERFAARRGCGLKPNLFLPLGAGSEHRRLATDPARIVDRFPEEAMDPRFLTPFRKKVGCGIGRELIALTPNGGVTPCPFLQDVRLGQVCGPEPAPGLSAGSTSGVSPAPPACAAADGALFGERLDYRFTVDDLPRCRACDFRYLCGGGCRAQAFSRTGDLAGPDPSCGLIQSVLCRTLQKVPRTHPGLAVEGRTE